MAPQTTTWPENVAARYLTAGGAAVDITVQTQITCEGDRDRGGDAVGDITLAARCTGCKNSDESTYEGLYVNRVDPVLESFYGEGICAWAQAHAETCRAMPKPTA